MAEFLQIVSFLDTLIRYPTVIFTVPLALILLYWLVSLLSGLGTDLLDGALEGVLGGADAALNGALDGAADGGLDGDGHGGLFEWIGAGGVPVSIIASVFVLAGWILAAGATAALGPGRVGWLAGLVVLLLAGGGALLVTKGAAKPLKKVFTTDVGLRNTQLIGRVCEIMTLRVTDKYGQAEVADGGAGLIIQVRSGRADELSKGSKALIHGYDAANDVFQVRAVGVGSETDLEGI